MAYENLLFDVQDGVGVITFNRPKVLNALNAHTIEELDEAVRAVERDRGVKALVLTGAGEKSFIAGADIAAMSTMTPAHARAFSGRGHGILERLELLPVPTIAAVNGYALGGGCEVQLACDLACTALGEHARRRKPARRRGLRRGRRRVPGRRTPTRSGVSARPNSLGPSCLTVSGFIDEFEISNRP